MDDSEAIARDLYYWVGEYHTAAGDRDAALARAEVAEGRVKRQDAILYELWMLDCNADSVLVRTEGLQRRLAGRDCPAAMPTLSWSAH